MRQGHEHIEDIDSLVCDKAFWDRVSALSEAGEWGELRATVLSMRLGRVGKPMTFQAIADRLRGVNSRARAVQLYQDAWKAIQKLERGGRLSETRYLTEGWEGPTGLFGTGEVFDEFGGVEEFGKLLKRFRRLVTKKGFSLRPVEILEGRMNGQALGEVAQSRGVSKADAANLQRIGLEQLEWLAHTGNLMPGDIEIKNGELIEMFGGEERFWGWVEEMRLEGEEEADMADLVVQHVSDGYSFRKMAEFERSTSVWMMHRFNTALTVLLRFAVGKPTLRREAVD